jgi:hypothetical protein
MLHAFVGFFYDLQSIPVLEAFGNAKIVAKMNSRSDGLKILLYILQI